MSALDKEQALKRQLEMLQAEHQRIIDSTSYRLGRLLTKAVRSPTSFICLPLDILRLARHARTRSIPPGPDSKPYRTVLDNWQALSRSVRAQSKQDIVFLFSGTTHIQQLRGNRPIRQTQALLARGVPVLFSYHRSRSDDPLPPFEADLLVQTPVDITMQLLNEIASADLGEARKLLIVSYPYPAIVEKIDTFRRHGWKIVYDCRDDWEEFAKVGMANWFEAPIEKRLVAIVDRTFCVSGPLVEKMRKLAPRSRVDLMPNAVEAGFRPSEYRRTPQLAPPIIGYFGHLSAAWFDWDALLEIALLRPQYRFEVIGHSAPAMPSLPANIVLVGPKPWNELHHHAAFWSAAIIPFRIGPLADGVDPIKIYEYLAFGHPVVSFRMPQIRDYPYTTTVENVSDFCTALDAACQLAPDLSVIDEFLAHNTWDVRAGDLLSALDD